MFIKMYDLYNTFVCNHLNYFFIASTFFFISAWKHLSANLIFLPAALYSAATSLTASARALSAGWRARFDGHPEDTFFVTGIQ